jgi:hypothetical protein
VRTSSLTVLAVVAVAVALALAGCALPMALERVEPQGRDPKTIEADKLACWQEAEAAHARIRGTALGAAVLFGVVGVIVESAINQDDDAAKRRRIEGVAEACLEQRGYTINRTTPSRWAP